MNNEINNEMHNVAQEQQNASNAEEPVQYLTFTLDGEAFATEISRVREVLEYTQVTPVPRTPDYMQGVINLRGSVVPVVDMRLQFAMPAGKQTVDTCIIIIEVSIDGQLLVLGALADSVQEVIDLRTEQLQPAPSLGTRINNEFISAMAKVDEGFVIVLDMDEVFTIDPDVFSNTSYSYQDVTETQVTDATVKEEQQQDAVDKTNTADTNTAKQTVEIDLDSAIAKHAEWKLKFRTAITKQEQLGVTEIVRDDCCVLGKWLHGSARSKYSSLNSYIECLNKHKAFHAEAGKVAQCINDKRYSEAEAMLTNNAAYTLASKNIASAIVTLRKETGL